MEVVQVNTSIQYEVRIDSGILKNSGEWTKGLDGKSYNNVAIVTDSNVNKLYADIVLQSYKNVGYNTFKYVVPAGELSKNIDNTMEIINWLQSNDMTRADLIVALGGGVIGDLVGFVASIYLRGIDFIQIPTTLLSAIDSSVGGKTAVNIKQGKNLVGTFWQPQLVICDTDTLATLSKEDFNSGVGEAVKYGCIWDESLFDKLKTPNWDSVKLKQIIARCVSIKAEIVSEDEQECGMRAVLNFGHTVAHAIEKLSDYKIPHGQAVAVGMCIAAKAGEKMSITKPGTSSQIENLLKNYDISTKTLYSAADLAQACLSDKKRSDDYIKFVTLKEIGRYSFTNIKIDDLQSFIESGMSGFDAIVSPSHLTGSIYAPPSKSDAHRAVVCAMLSTGGVNNIYNIGSNDDIAVTLAAAKALGATFVKSKDSVQLQGITNPPRSAEIYCKESGSSLRFFTPIAAALGVTTKFYGEGRLPERPMTPLLNLLSSHGISVTKENGEMFTINGKLTAGVFEVPGDISSQYITGLMFALSILSEPSEIIITSTLESKRYIDMTISTMKLFGVNIEEDFVSSQYGRYYIASGQKYIPTDYTVEGDYSGATFWLCAAAMGQDIEICGLNEYSLQADREVLEVLKYFGCSVKVKNNNVEVLPQNLNPIDIDAANIPDSVPALAVLASSIKGTTTIYNAGRLKIKESDRLESTTNIINTLGGDTEVTDDGILINGGNQLHGGTVDSFDDHRISMAAAIAALKASGKVKILNAHCIRKSYPNFFSDLIKLGGTVDVI